MKKILTFLSLSLFSVSIAHADSITCPNSLHYICKKDPSCEVTKCTITSYAHPAWNFSAPARPLDKNPDQSSCSILPPGTYDAGYMASIYGPATGIGIVAYCLYGQIDHDISFSGLYTTKYKKGDGNWQAAPPDYVCNKADECYFIPV